MVSGVMGPIGRFITPIVYGAPQEIVGNFFARVGLDTASTVGSVGHKILGVPSAPFRWLGVLVEGIGEFFKNNAMLIGSITALFLLIYFIRYCMKKWSASKSSHYELSKLKVPVIDTTKLLIPNPSTHTHVINPSTNK
jgi:hypothetical protein